MNQEEKFKLNGKTSKNSVLIELIIYILFWLGPLTGNVILVLFGVLSTEFSVNINSLLIAIPSFMFPFAIFQLFSGALSDIKGRFPVILFGLILFGLGMLIAALSFSLMAYIIANILGGIGFGFVNPVLIALMSDITSGPKIPKKMGYMGAVANLGVGVGPLIAGLMVTYGWRYLYLLFILITVIGFVVILLLRKHPKIKKDTSFKLFLSHLTHEIRRKVVLLLIFSAFLTSHTYLASVIWTSRAFTGIIEENLAGLILALVGIIGALAGIIMGIVIEKKGVGYALIFGLISLFLGMIILTSVGKIEIESLGFITIGLIFMGMAGGTLIPSIMFYSQTLSKERRGALAGLATAGQFIGIALIPTIYEPFFHSGGIGLVYLAVLIVSIFLLIAISLLFILAKKR
ncbi:MAG: MFS transporter [Candidatus Thorarchaeota archaeon]